MQAARFSHLLPGVFRAEDGNSPIEIPGVLPYERDVPRGDALCMAARFDALVAFRHHHFCAYRQYGIVRLAQRIRQVDAHACQVGFDLDREGLPRFGLRTREQQTCRESGGTAGPAADGQPQLFFYRLHGCRTRGIRDHPKFRHVVRRRLELDGDRVAQERAAKSFARDGLALDDDKAIDVCQRRGKSLHLHARIAHLQASVKFFESRIGTSRSIVVVASPDAVTRSSWPPSISLIGLCSARSSNDSTVPFEIALRVIIGSIRKCETSIFASTVLLPTNSMRLRCDRRLRFSRPRVACW